MPLKLSYNPIYSFTLADVFNSSDDQMSFTASSRQNPAWAALVRDWLKANKQDYETAAKIISLSIKTISQKVDVDGDLNGDAPVNIYPMDTIDAVNDVKDAIEESAPGNGEQFIIDLALGFYNLHFRRLEEQMGN